MASEAIVDRMPAARLSRWVGDARQRTLDMLADLSDEQLLGPKLGSVNPPLWEAGHQAWFQEKWVLRHALGRPPLREDADALWDSMAIPHDDRWTLPLPSRDETEAYMREVRDRVLESLDRGDADPQLLYFAAYSVFHEDMHAEASLYTRQTLGYAPPPLSDAQAPHASAVGGNGARTVAGDVEVPGGTFMLGATSEEPFAFDNEKWAHPVEVRPFLIARTPVTQAELVEFVAQDGYRRRELWSEEGWRWREEVGAEHPVYWRRESDGAWSRRHFDRWIALEPHLPLVHVNWHEAEAYCRWAGRRLPTEAEWELAAAGERGEGGALSPRKRVFPWGDDPPSPERANLDARAMGCLEVHARPDGDSAFGCRQLIGNVWEWTASTFGPYPGFVPDPYEEYSEPWFAEGRKVLRGGAWASRGRMLRNTWRNFFTPERRDVFAGFRTCAPPQ